MSASCFIEMINFCWILYTVTREMYKGFANGQNKAGPRRVLNIFALLSDLLGAQDEAHGAGHAVGQTAEVCVFGAVVLQGTQAVYQ